jgi:hypothetical protein
MKKIVFVLAVLSFMSCKKDYDCTCTDQSGTTVEVHVIEKVNSKAKAERQCTDYYTQKYGSKPFNQTTCAIK